MHGERRHRRTAGPGHGTQAGIPVVDEHKDEDMTTEGGRQRKTWDLPFREIFDVLRFVSTVMGRVSRRRTDDVQKVRAVGGGTTSPTAQKEYPYLRNAGEFITTSTALH